MRTLLGAKHGLVVAYLALFIALGGTSFAVATGSIDSRELKNDTVRSKDVRNNTLEGRDVRNGSLVSDDFAPGQLPKGDQGPTGPQGTTGATGARGLQGAQGVPGISGLVQVSANSANNSESSKSTVATCPPGKRAISGAADINRGTSGDFPDQLTDVVITNSGSPSPETTVPGTLFARAHEEEPHAGDWNVQVRGICANVNP